VRGLSASFVSILRFIYVWNCILLVVLCTLAGPGQGFNTQNSLEIWAKFLGVTLDKFVKVGSHFRKGRDTTSGRYNHKRKGLVKTQLFVCSSSTNIFKLISNK
jgi:hypothetical protein